MAKKGIVLTEEGIASFLGGLDGLRKTTVQSYRKVMKDLYEFLPEGKALSRNTWEQWKAALLDMGYKGRTVNFRLSVLNSYLESIGRREWQNNSFVPEETIIQPELSRREYCRMLTAARAAGNEKSYLLIKTLGSTEILMRELNRLTVEAVQSGQVTLEKGAKKRVVHLPELLRRELLGYAGRVNVRSGPIFLMPSGEPIDRSSVHHFVSCVSRDARVEANKATPSALSKLYRKTIREVEKNMYLLVEQAYERMLETEQLTIGWDVS